MYILDYIKSHRNRKTLNSENKICLYTLILIK